MNREDELQGIIDFQTLQIKELEDKTKLTKGFIQMALDELGVPNKDYPAPVANAVDFLREALKLPRVPLEINMQTRPDKKDARSCKP